MRSVRVQFLLRLSTARFAQGSTLHLCSRFDPCCELESQLAKRRSHPCFYRLHRYAHHVRNLSVREFVSSTEQKAFANRFAERRNGFTNRDVEFFDARRDVGCGRFEGNGFIADHGFEPSHIVVVPDRIQHAIPHRAKQICLARIVGIERFAPPPQLEQDILDDVLRHAPTTQHPFREADEGHIVPAKQDVEGAFVTVPDALQELDVFHGNGRIPSLEIRCRSATIGL